MKSPVYLDANAIIDFVEQRHEGLQLLFARVDHGSITLLTSELTLAEVLVRPLQRGEDWLRRLYEGLLVEDGVVRMMPIDIGILRRSAQIRAGIGGKSPDSIHVATALSHGCDRLVSSDKRLRMPDGIARIGANEIDAAMLRDWE